MTIVSEARVPELHVREAMWVAYSAAARAGVSVRELETAAERVAAADLLGRLWNSDASCGPLNTDVMRAVSYAGGYVAGAFDDDRLVGVTVGFLGHQGKLHVHSHIAGVAPEAQGRQVGFVLKLHQRWWALHHGIDTITWTFDPLVRRNAYFNIAKLRAFSPAYLVDFYGDMTDGVNAGQGSDRLLATWLLDTDPVRSAAAGEPLRLDAANLLAADRVVLRADDQGRPVPRGTGLSAGDVLCAIPQDIARVRLTEPEVALAWRFATRDALTSLFANGYQVRGICKAGWYLLSQDDVVGTL
jgi:predicted GNAT superfamily acetyltransferase